MKKLKIWSILAMFATTLSVFFSTESYAMDSPKSKSTVVPYNDNRQQANGKQEKHKTMGDVTRGLIVYFNFDDGTANNVAGMQNNGVINGAVKFISDTPNGRGQALYLDQEAFINVARNPIKNKRDLTLSMWVKDFGSGYLFANPSDNCSFPQVFINGENKIQGCNYRNAFNYNVKVLQNSGWHMITIVQSEENGIDLYIDGNLTDNINDRVSSDGNKIQLGGRNDREGNAWADPFKVDNVRIYGVALTESEVAQLYNYERN